MTLNSKPLALIILVVLFGGILFSSAMGWWQTESTKEAATFSEGEFAGQPNPADIRAHTPQRCRKQPACPRPRVQAFRFRQ
jgi:hypothetical protein